MTDNDWHLDKKVPITLIFLLLGQLAFGAYWVAKQDSRVTAIENALIDLAGTVESNKTFQIEQRVRVWNELNGLAAKQNDTNESLARLQGQLEQMNRNMERLLNRMENNRNG